MRWLPTLLAALAFCPSAWAAELAVYDLTIRGIKVGVMSLRSDETPSQYSVAARMDNTGLTRIFRQFGYSGSASGAIRRGQLVPARYVEEADTGKRVSSVELRFAGGRPEVLRYESTGDTSAAPADPAAQRGAIDPLSAVYALLRDVPPEQACGLNALLYDGRRSSRITTTQQGTRDGLPVCAGTYERLEGFTAEELESNRRLGFQVLYMPGPGERLRVREVIFDSVLGKAAIARR